MKWTKKRKSVETQNSKPKCILENIKAHYFLEQIFELLSKKTSLNIIKYNKNIQKSLNITTKDFREYLELYSTIEVELITIRNINGEIMNFNKKEDEPYFHFNFDKNIKITIDYQVNSLRGLFKDCKSIESIIFKKFYRKNINDMSCMFSGCSSLKEIDLSNFNTDNVTNMVHMFSGCSSLKELNLSNFNTCKVTKMDYMFYGCSSLEKIDVSNFSNDNLTSVGFMFSGCSSLNEINLHNFKTNKVTYMDSMFYECFSLKDIDISSFDTRKVTNMIAMFGECSDELTTKIQEKFPNIAEEAFYDE